MKLFFNYSIDCETPANTGYTEHTERRDFFSGPASWDFAQRSAATFVEKMRELDAAAGTTLFVYPDVALHQKELYRGLAEAGVEIALHLNGLRYSRLTGDHAQWLGAMDYERQHEALRMGKEDLEQVTGRPCLGYRACYGSANNDTFPICEELGFTWTSQPSGRYRPEFHSNWAGSWPYPHHPSRRCKMICGDMTLYEMPISRGIHTCFRGLREQPLDLRVETSPDILGEDRAMLRQVVEENLIEMDHREAPVRAIIGGSHNTNPFGDPSSHQAQNLEWLLRHTRELAQSHDLDFTPASFEQMLAQGKRVNSY